jgi:hypothetical protein
MSNANEVTMTPSKIATQAQQGGAKAAGAVLFNGSVYDRRLQRCRVYAIADGEGGIEWRVIKEPYDSDDAAHAVERCFHTYAEAMRWLA